MYCEATCGEGQIPSEPQPGRFTKVSIPVNDANLGVVQRTFGIYIPEPYSKDAELPLLMFFHGSGGHGSQNCNRGWCNISMSDPDGPFIVVQVRINLDLKQCETSEVQKLLGMRTMVATFYCHRTHLVAILVSRLEWQSDNQM